jgi:hypothetical protein
MEIDPSSPGCRRQRPTNLAEALCQLREPLAQRCALAETQTSDLGS